MKYLVIKTFNSAKELSDFTSQGKDSGKMAVAYLEGRKFHVYQDTKGFHVFVNTEKQLKEHK